MSVNDTMLMFVAPLKIQLATAVNVGFPLENWSKQSEHATFEGKQKFSKPHTLQADFKEPAETTADCCVTLYYMCLGLEVPLFDCKDCRGRPAKMYVPACVSGPLLMMFEVEGSNQFRCLTQPVMSSSIWWLISVSSFIYSLMLILL